MSDVGKWSVTAASNDASPPDGAPEGMTKPNFNNVMREMMAAVARMYRDMQWGDFWNDHDEFSFSRTDADTFVITSSSSLDQTAYFTEGRRVKIVGVTTAYGWVGTPAASYSGGDTTVNLTSDSDDVPTGITDVFVYAMEDLRKAAFDDYNVIGQGRHTISVPATAITPMEDNGCLDIARYKTTGNNPEIIGLEFQDSQAATGSILFENNPTANEYITLNGQNWTFDTNAGTSVGYTTIGGSLASTIQSLVGDLNNSANTSIDDATYSSTGSDTLSITHDTAGTAGNSYTLADDGVIDVVRSGSSLAGGTDEQYATFSVEMPKSWDATTNEIQVELRLLKRSASGGNDVIFKVDAVAIGDGDDMDTSWGTAQAWSAVTLTNAEYTYLSGELGTALTVGGSPSADGEMVIFRIQRDPTDASDTLTTGCLLIGARVYIDLAASTDD